MILNDWIRLTKTVNVHLLNDTILFRITGLAGKIDFKSTKFPSYDQVLEIKFRLANFKEIICLHFN